MKTKVHRAPPVSEATILRVYVAAGGICSFFGCSRSVMRETLTGKPARLGHIAHIVGESLDGPRGEDVLPLEDRNQFENLMLMCTEHHTFIDKKENVSLYPPDQLVACKKEHEDRIKRQISVPIDAITQVIRVTSKIRGDVTVISEREIPPALFENERRYAEKWTVDIDLNNLHDTNDAAYWQSGKSLIDRVLHEQIFPLFERQELKRISLFALGRIPLLIYLGIRLGDKIPTTLYQKNRAPGEGWIWPKNGAAVEFKITKHLSPVHTGKVSLVVSASGKIDLEKVKRAYGESIIYEIEPIGEQPSRFLLSSPVTIENFRKAYHDFMSKVEIEHPKVEEFGYFLATPCSFAIVCGRDLQKGTVPRLVIYDKVEEEYVSTITLEKNDYDQK